MCLVCGLVVLVLGLWAITATSQPPNGKPGGETQVVLASDDLPVDPLFARLKTIREQREALAKEEQTIIVLLRGKVQRQRQALAVNEQRMKLFEQRAAMAKAGLVRRSGQFPPGASLE